MGLSQQDIESIKALIQREPTQTEKTVFDTMWSEHCSYKSTKSVLKGFPTKGKEVVLGVGEDAGIVHFTEHNGKSYGIAVSHESHNHPSQVLPVEGAATGVGGVVRDVYCMGAEVFGVCNSLHFGLPGLDDHAETIAHGVVQGVAEYGNALGVPVLGGETLYHKSYNENCLVNVAAFGLVEENQIIRSKVPACAKDEPYDVILVGKSTDSTGFGGASFSSEILDAQTDNIGAVQVHDPFLKRVLVESFKMLWQRVKEWDIQIGVKDLGAGGISCATSEIAMAGGFGVQLDLDTVNLAVKDLAPEVIACSETQERYCIVAPQSHREQILAIFNDEFELGSLYHQAGAVVIGKVISEQRFVITHQSQVVCDLAVEAITTEVSVERASKMPEKTQQKDPILELNDDQFRQVLLDIPAHLMCCSKRYVYRHFDQAVRGATVSYPGESDAVVTTPVAGCEVGCAVSMDSNLYGEYDPYLSGAAAVAESVRNIIAVGAQPLAITDCLNYGSPEDPQVFASFKEGVRGIKEAAQSLGITEDHIPVISGNVSLYNQSKAGNAIVPSPVICTIGKIADVKKRVKTALVSEDLTLIYIGEAQQKWAGTVLGDLLKSSQGLCFEESFELNWQQEQQQNKAVLECIQNQWVEACHDIASGGLWQSLVEMLLGERANRPLGLDCDISSLNQQDLFAENGGYVLAVKAQNLETVNACLDQYSISTVVFAKTVLRPTVQLKNEKGIVAELSFEALKQAFNRQNLAVFATPV